MPLLYAIGRCEILKDIKRENFTDLNILECSDWTHTLNDQFIQESINYCKSNKQQFGIVLFVNHDDYAAITGRIIQQQQQPPLRSLINIHKDCVLFRELCALQDLKCYYNDSITCNKYKCLFFCKETPVGANGFIHNTNFNTFLKNTH